MSVQRDFDEARDRICLEGLDVECIVGLYEHERDRPQRLIIDVTLCVDIDRAASEERLEATVDYEWVSTQIAFVLKLGQFRLLETAAKTICQTLLLAPLDGEARAAIQAVDLSVRKPAALGGRGVPRLRMCRQASDRVIAQETKPFGTVDVIHETQSVGFYRLNVFPGRRIGLHVHQRMLETELVLSAGLHCQGELAARGSVRQWPKGLPHYYENRTAQTQSLLCVDRPPFSEDDEIATDARVGTIVSKSVWEL